MNGADPFLAKDGEAPYFFWSTRSGLFQVPVVKRRQPKITNTGGDKNTNEKDIKKRFDV